jgi:hypothetical protein
VAAVEPERIPGVLAVISERFVSEASSEQAATLWAATKVLMGLRCSEEQVEEFISGVSGMILGIHGIEESSVYQGIFAKGETKGEAKGEAKGRVEEARLAILRLGRKKFGEPDPQVSTTIDAIDDVDQLNSLMDRILDVSSWDDLLTFPGPPACVSTRLSRRRSS